MDLIFLVVVTGVIFLIGDAVMLSNVIKPIIAQHLGDTLLGEICPLPATMLYVIYMTGVVWFLA